MLQGLTVRALVGSSQKYSQQISLRGLVCLTSAWPSPLLLPQLLIPALPQAAVQSRDYKRNICLCFVPRLLWVPATLPVSVTFFPTAYSWLFILFNYQLSFVKISLIIFIVAACVQECMSWYTCGDERKTCMSWFVLSIMRILGTELRSSDLAASTLLPEPLLWISPYFEFFVLHLKCILLPDTGPVCARPRPHPAPLRFNCSVLLGGLEVFTCSLFHPICCFFELPRLISYSNGCIYESFIRAGPRSLFPRVFHNVDCSDWLSVRIALSAPGSLASGDFRRFRGLFYCPRHFAPLFTQKLSSIAAWL